MRRTLSLQGDSVLVTTWMWKVPRDLAALLIGWLCLAAGSTSAAQQPAAATRVNPLLEESSLSLRAPRFDRITPGDFREAFERAMERHVAEVRQIATAPQPATFANTIEPLEKAGTLLRRTNNLFGLLLATVNEPALLAIDTEYAPKLAAHAALLNLDPQVFARVKSIYDRRASLNLDEDQAWLVDRTYRGLVRAGAGLAPRDRDLVRGYDAESSRIVSAIRQKVLAEMTAAALVVDDRELLDGLPEADVAAAQIAAAAGGFTGKWMLPLQNTTQQPALSYLRNRSIRQQLFKASTSRNTSGDNDTTALIRRLAQLRALRASLLGFDTHAAFTLDNQMAKTPESALALMTGMVPATMARRGDEATRLEQRLRSDVNDPSATLQPWDWQYYAEAVKRADYGLDQSEVRQYFELDRVLRDGVFYTATALYGISFRERKDLPVYHPDVRVFEVIDKDGKTPLGLFYADYFAKPTKRGGAWTSTLIEQSTLLGTTPVVTNNCNFVKPAPGNPALLTADEVDTMFHEFGHALHALFSGVRYPSLNGTPRDYVEMPSQFNAHWATDPSVFDHYARHYRTGDAMPAALKAKIQEARLFNEGYSMTEKLAASFLDLDWHALSQEQVPTDIAAFEAASLRKHGVAAREVPPRYSSPYFSHIWTQGYSAGYYSYVWSEVLDTDVYYWFKDHGGLTRDNGQRFRDLVLSRGGAQDVSVIYRGFLGRDASPEPLLRERGLK